MKKFNVIAFIINAKRNRTLSRVWIEKKYELNVQLHDGWIGMMKIFRHSDLNEGEKYILHT